MIKFFTNRDKKKEMKPILLQCRDVTKSFNMYEQNLHVLSKINLQVNPGEKILIYGKSGQGKSVLLSLLGGLDIQTSGDIIYNGLKLNACSCKKLAELRRYEIGIIFQNLNLIPSWTALQNVEAALENIINSAAKRRRLAVELLEYMGLKNRLNHLPAEMSMGEQQRVAISRTLIRKPKLILADEPTGDLDDENANDIINLLYSYSRENDAALLITTHGHFPIQNFDRIYVLNNGELNFKQPSETYFAK